MPTRQWDVTLDDQRHTVELDPGEALGKVKVRRGRRAGRGRSDLVQCDFRFEIAGRSAIMRIKQEWLGLQHGYRLIVDGAEVL